MTKNKAKYILAGVIIIIVLAIDLISKHYLENIEYTKIIPHIIAFCSNGGNTGGAFGIFSNSTLILSIFSVAMLIVFLVLDIKLKITNKIYTIGLSLVFGGAIGNLIDRLSLGYVRDFIMFDFWKSFPIFNFADSCLCIGIVLLCVYFLFVYEKDKKTKG